MERNVQIERKAFVPLLIIAVFLCLSLSGCGQAFDPEDGCEIGECLAAYAGDDGGYDGRAAAFADTVCVASAANDSEPAVTGDSAAVLDLSGNTALFQKNAFARMNPASTTKIMTAILAMKYGNPEDEVTATDAVVIDEPGSSMAGLKPGDVMTLEQLLYGLMLPSGNDAANAIAVHIAGSVENFAQMMNEEARRIGATGTHFMNANGLTDPDHYTTAYDLYLIFNEALKYEMFRTIIGTPTYSASYRDAQGEPLNKTWSSSNLYLIGRADEPEGLTVFGGKTGTTKAAGYCLIVGCQDKGGNEYAAVVMSAESRSALYDDMTKILSKIVK